MVQCPVCLCPFPSVVACEAHVDACLGRGRIGRSTAPIDVDDLIDMDLHNDDVHMPKLELPTGCSQVQPGECSCPHSAANHHYHFQSTRKIAELETELKKEKDKRKEIETQILRMGNVRESTSGNGASRSAAPCTISLRLFRSPATVRFRVSSTKGCGGVSAGCDGGRTSPIELDGSPIDVDESNASNNDSNGSGSCNLESSETAETDHQHLSNKDQRVRPEKAGLKAELKREREKSLEAEARFYEMLQRNDVMQTHISNMLQRNQVLQQQLDEQRSRNVGDFQKVVASEAEAQKKLCALESEFTREMQKTAELEHRFRCLAQSHQSIQEELGVLKAQSRQFLTSFETVQSSHRSSLLAELQLLRDHFAELGQPLDDTVNNFAFDLKKLNEGQRENTELADVEQMLDTFAQTVNGMAENLPSQITDKTGQLQTLVSAVCSDVSQFTSQSAGKLEVLPAYPLSLCQVLETTNHRLFVHHAEFVDRATKESASVSAKHQENSKGITDSIFQQMKDDWAAAKSEWEEMEKEDERQEDDAIDELMKRLKRKRADKQSKIESADEISMRPFRSGLRDRLTSFMYETKIGEQAAAIASRAVDSLRGGRENACHAVLDARARASDALKQTCRPAVSSSLEALGATAKSFQATHNSMCEHQQSRAMEANAFSSRLSLLRTSHAAIRSDLSQLEELCVQHDGDSDEVLKRRKLTDTKCQDALATVQCDAHRLAENGITKIQELDKMVDGFHTIMCNAELTMDDFWRSPLPMSPTPRSRMTDPQGREHPRTPLQSIVNRELFNPSSPIAF